MNHVLAVIKTIGTKLLAIVQWPFTHATMLAHLMKDVPADTKATAEALVGLVAHFEALGADAIHIYAEKGLDFTDDKKALADVVDLFKHFRDEVCPVIKKEFQDIASDVKALPDPAPGLPQPNPTPVIVSQGPLAPA